MKNVPVQAQIDGEFCGTKCPFLRKTGKVLLCYKCTLFHKKARTWARPGGGELSYRIKECKIALGD